MLESTLLGVLFLAAYMFATASNLALRHVSFSRLTKLLIKRGRERRVESYRDHYNDLILSTATIRMLSALCLILTIVHITYEAGLFVTPSFRDTGIVFAIAAVLSFIFGIAIPHAWGTKYAGAQLLSWAFPVIWINHQIHRPFLYLYKLLDELVRRLAGAPRVNDEEDSEQMEQEVLDAVTEAKLYGAMDDQEKRMIESVMALNETTAGQIMTPRTELVAVGKDISLSNLKAVIKKEGHSRIPVFEEHVDQILGMVYAKDLLQIEQEDAFDVEHVLRSVPFVPETKSLRDLLQEFQTGKTHAAIVLDEYGGTAGLVTIEDILEELVGEIADEFETPEPDPIVQIDEHTFEVDSKVHVDELNKRFELNIPEHDDYETVGGFVFSELGKIPTSGEQLEFDQLKIIVLEAEDRRINRLRIEQLHAPKSVT